MARITANFVKNFGLVAAFSLLLTNCGYDNQTSTLHDDDNVKAGKGVRSKVAEILRGPLAERAKNEVISDSSSKDHEEKVDLGIGKLRIKYSVESEVEATFVDPDENFKVKVEKIVCKKKKNVILMTFSMTCPVKGTVKVKVPNFAQGTVDFESDVETTQTSLMSWNFDDEGVLTTPPKLLDFDGAFVDPEFTLRLNHVKDLRIPNVNDKIESSLNEQADEWIESNLDRITTVGTEILQEATKDGKLQKAMEEFVFVCEFQ